jgi:hypothetical protein
VKFGVWRELEVTINSAKFGLDQSRVFRSAGPENRRLPVKDYISHTMLQSAAALQGDHGHLCFTRIPGPSDGVTSS